MVKKCSKIQKNPKWIQEKKKVNPPIIVLLAGTVTLLLFSWPVYPLNEKHN